VGCRVVGAVAAVGAVGILVLRGCGAAWYRQGHPTYRTIVMHAVLDIAITIVNNQHLHLVDLGGDSHDVNGHTRLDNGFSLVALCANDEVVLHRSCTHAQTQRHRDTETETQRHRDTKTRTHAHHAQMHASCFAYMRLYVRESENEIAHPR
jgi:hypothetical protein